MKGAVCILIEHPITGKVLCVSRGADLTNWGLPGGKVEYGESLDAAAHRELYEETGLALDQFDLLLSYHERVCRGDDDYNCTVFRLLNPSDRVLEFEFQDSSEGNVEWKQWDALLAPTASFKDYNLELIRKLNDENC